MPVAPRLDGALLDCAAPLAPARRLIERQELTWGGLLARDLDWQARHGDCRGRLRAVARLLEEMAEPPPE